MLPCDVKSRGKKGKSAAQGAIRANVRLGAGSGPSALLAGNWRSRHSSASEIGRIVKRREHFEREPIVDCEVK